MKTCWRIKGLLNDMWIEIYLIKLLSWLFLLLFLWALMFYFKLNFHLSPIRFFWQSNTGANTLTRNLELHFVGFVLFYIRSARVGIYITVFWHSEGAIIDFVHFKLNFLLNKYYYNNQLCLVRAFSKSFYLLLLFLPLSFFLFFLFISFSICENLILWPPLIKKKRRVIKDTPTTA